MLISVKCVERYWRSYNLPFIQILGGSWGRIVPRGHEMGWCVSECGEFCTRFYSPENGEKDYLQTARDSIIAALPVSHVDSIDPHFADLDLEDPLNFCRGVYDVVHKDDARGEQRRYAALQPRDNEQPQPQPQPQEPLIMTAYGESTGNQWRQKRSVRDDIGNYAEVGDHVCSFTPTRNAAIRDMCLLCMAIEQKKDEAYIAVLWNPHCQDGEAKWIYRGAVGELRVRQSEIRAAMAKSGKAYADGVASYTARIKAWLDAHVMESYSRENVPLMTDEEADVWRRKMVDEATKATPWAAPEAEAEAPKKRRRKAAEDETEEIEV